MKKLVCSDNYVRGKYVCVCIVYDSWIIVLKMIQIMVVVVVLHFFYCHHKNSVCQRQITCNLQF